MNNEFVHSIGLMSGTSLDGVDLIYVKIHLKEYSNFDILEKATIPYDTKWIDLLKDSINFNDKQLNSLDEEFGKYLGHLISGFVTGKQIENLDFVASHGHTIFHQPDKGVTLQIGNGQEIANIVNTKVICDFRIQDVQLGGQGAPLVPIGDQLLFSQYEACLNLGGFANVSFEQDHKRIAYDICAVNTVLNQYAQMMGYDYDDNGLMASGGVINSALLEELNALPFYKSGPPKSLGIEWVRNNVIPKIDKCLINHYDVLRTYVEHIAIQISSSLEGIKNVLITGGGAYNTFLINRIKLYYHGEIILPEDSIIEYKEALIFSLLGLLKSQNKVNCLQSVTGAKKDHSTGRIFNPKIK